MTAPSRPSFALEFPSDADLEAALDAFAAGNYAQTRAICARVTATHGDERVRLAAAELRRRTDPDPLALRLLALTAALLVFLGGWWIVYGKPPAAHSPPAAGAPHHE